MLQFHFVDVMNYAFEAMTISRKKKSFFRKTATLNNKMFPQFCYYYLNNTRLGFSTFKFYNAKT